MAVEGFISAACDAAAQGLCLPLWQLLIIILLSLALHALHLYAFVRVSKRLKGKHEWFRWLAAVPGIGFFAW
jgi:hypothetical protein